MEDLQALLSKEFHLITAQSAPGHIVVKMNNGAYESFLKVEENEHSIAYLNYLHPNLSIIPNQDPNLVGAAIRLFVDTFQVKTEFASENTHIQGKSFNNGSRFIPSLVWDSEDIYNEIIFVYVSNLDKEHLVWCCNFLIIHKILDTQLTQNTPILLQSFLRTTRSD